MRKLERSGLDYVASKLDDFVGAARGEMTPCAVFRGPSTFAPEFTEEQKRSIIVYVESWIREPLQAVIAGLDGDRTFANEEHLRALAQGLHDRPTMEDLEIAYRDRGER